MVSATQRHKVFLAGLILLFFIGGCGSCDEVGSGTGIDDGDAGYGDDVRLAPDTSQIDVDGGHESDADVIDEPDVELEPCDEEQEGHSRPCGTDEGECQFGLQACQNGFWGPCLGGVQPRDEQCSGLDESCSGVADDEDDLCSFQSACIGNGQCVDGSCEYEPLIDCSYLDGPCTVGECDAKSGGCRAVPIEDGTSCDDGDFCTVGGICQEGQCISDSRDCSGASDDCNVGVCDSELEACVPSPVSDGASCDDGLFCTVNTTCSEGQCVGNERNCASVGDQCNVGYCDEATGACETTPVADDTPCDNGLFCTVEDTCQNGVCTAGPERSCDADGGGCQVGVCDEDSNSCVGDPLPDGTTCDDGLFCTVNTECVSGQCVGGAPRDCSAAGDQCNDGVCDESINSCVPDPVNDGTSCDDGLYCTVGNTCLGGSCASGFPRDCSGLTDQCNDGHCSESSEACLAQPANIGSSCDDGFYCTVDTLCTANGTCEGQPRDCSYLDGTCHYGLCDESSQSCLVVDEPDGMSCEDGLFCTVSETCQGGECVGEPRDCTYLEDDCLVDSYCDESQASCLATNICDPCEDGTPTADPVAPDEVIPNTPIQLNGTGSTDPNNQDLTYHWTVEEQPDGSNASLDDPNSATPTIMGDVSGEFVICLTVTNEEGCESEAQCVTVLVKPEASLHIELTWDPDDQIDFDLHYLAPDGQWFDRDQSHPPGQRSDCGDPDHNATSVWWCVRNPDWGGGAGGEPDGDPTNDPLLDIDDLYGDAPENINQDVLFDGDGFRVGVHMFYDYGNGADEARVRIYVDGQLEFEEYHTISCGQMWEVAEIDVSGNGTNVTITSLNKQVLEPSEQGSLALDGC